MLPLLEQKELLSNWVSLPGDPAAVLSAYGQAHGSAPLRSGASAPSRRRESRPGSTPASHFHLRGLVDLTPWGNIRGAFLGAQFGRTPLPFSRVPYTAALPAPLSLCHHPD